MTSMLEKITNDDRFDCVDDAICENCQTYQDYGRLLVELLEYNAGSGDFEQKAHELLSAAVRDYIDETI